MLITITVRYHAGWNSGFNVAEACNMALLPWLGYAAASIEKYSSIRKSCVFCFEAFLCRIACSDRTVVTARHLLPHLKQALQREVKLRGADMGEAVEEEAEDMLCDAATLAVAANVDGVECCNCKRLCHFSYYTSSSSSSNTIGSSSSASPQNIFCPKCAASSPSDPPLTFVERVRCL